ncbi:MAG: hypothetical protein ACKV22_32295 [Bryobacteraceae bacterium]
MIRTVAFLVFSASMLAGVKVGVFPEQIRHAFTTAQGLPDDRVNCIAAVGGTVYAGTAKGLARFSGTEWKAQKNFDQQPVELCTATAGSLYFLYGTALYRTAGDTTSQIAGLPAGTPRSIAANAGWLFYATDQGLSQIMGSAGAFTPIPLPVEKADVRQIAVAPSGQVAVAAGEGLFVKSGSNTWTAVYPQDGDKSWAPRDVRGVAYDSKGRLWFGSPQGAGCLDAEKWKLFTGLDGLPYDDFTTVAAGEPGVVWFGTTLGAIRYDGKTWEYRQGLRWLPDDRVQAISVLPDGNTWFATSKGAGLIERKPTTLAKKAKFFEDEIDKRHRRTEYEYVMSVRLARSGDKSEWIQEDSDNDGLWTSMYGAGECFAYAATKDPLARKRARKAFEALRFLSVVTQGGEHPAPPGFPARAILPASGRDPNANDSRERDLRMRAQRDHLWKVMSPRWPKSADGKWYWKTDTSSDELDGHYFFYAQYYDLAAETPQEKEDVQNLVRAITDHLLEHNYSLVDWDGQPTRWAIFDPVNLNDNRNSWEGRGLNSLSILSYLKVAAHVTGDRKYQEAYERLISEHKYATNAMVPKISAGLGSGNQSDDEMAFMSFYSLLKYETNDDLLQKYGYALANYWAIERPEMNPFFNFVAAASLAGKKFAGPFRTYDLTLRGDWLDDSVDTLRRLPRDRVDWRHQNSHRKDLVRIRPLLAEDSERHGSGYRRNGKVIPADERFFSFWNHNPYSLNTGGIGTQLADGAVFLLPYYMGLYHRYIEE